MYFDPCFKYLTIFFILENLSSKIGGYIHQFSLKMQIHRSDFNVTNISGTGTINVISTMHPLENFLRSTSQKNNFLSLITMVCISHCHIMVLSMLMLWLPKNNFLNLFFVFEHFFFHFYSCALRLMCIIFTFILHIKLWINFICEFFICLHTICKHYSSLTKITR